MKKRTEMICTCAMKGLLSQYLPNQLHDIPLNASFPIWEKRDEAGRPYWATSDFCGMDLEPITRDRDLSQLEWDGNEVYLSGRTREEITSILFQGIGIMLFWKKEMETKYPHMPFFILASFDNGDAPVLEEGELPVQSLTLRFWAHRGTSALIHPESLENLEQPVMMISCNTL